MFSESADLYDAIYTSFKDYKAEAGQVADLLKQLRPEASSVLDVACGTGEHARYLNELGYRVDGVDLEEGFVKQAAAKNSGRLFVQGDMASFDLGHRYDVVLCLFSSIGYVITEEKLQQTLKTFARHLEPGGVILVEPWFPPGILESGYVHQLTTETDELKACRMGHTVVEGDVSHLHFEYLVGDGATGIRHFREQHTLGLFTRGQMEEAFHVAGLQVAFDEAGLTDRGLYTGEHK